MGKTYKDKPPSKELPRQERRFESSKGRKKQNLKALVRGNKDEDLLECVTH